MTDRAKVMVIYGTRPEAVKVAPLIKALDMDEGLVPIVVTTAQHREMLDQVNSVFGIVPDFDLNLMSPGQSINQIAGSVITEVDRVLSLQRPDAVLVQGDTTTVAAAAFAAFNRSIPVIHLEAGLRSRDLGSPFPEEGNRKMVSQVARLHLAPTNLSQQNLLEDGVDPTWVDVVGNTVIDALRWAIARPEELNFEGAHLLNEPGRRVLLVTTHRRENLGPRMERIGKAMRELAIANPDLLVLWPAHKNPKVRNKILPQVRDLENVLFTEPLGYGEFSRVMFHSHIVLTDSGGIQEEAPSLGKPVLVLRENTERPEGVDAGTVKLIGTDTARIVSEVSRLLHDDEAYAEMANAVNPYGDGYSAERCVAAIHQMFDELASQKK